MERGQSNGSDNRVCVAHSVYDNHIFVRSIKWVFLCIAHGHYDRFMYAYDSRTKKAHWEAEEKNKTGKNKCICGMNKFILLCISSHCFGFYSVVHKMFRKHVNGFFKQCHCLVNSFIITFVELTAAILCLYFVWIFIDIFEHFWLFGNINYLLQIILNQSKKKWIFSVIDFW